MKRPGKRRTEITIERHEVVRVDSGNWTYCTNCGSYTRSLTPEQVSHSLDLTSDELDLILERRQIHLAREDGPAKLVCGRSVVENQDQSSQDDG